MPTYDSAKKEILVTDKHGCLHCYFKCGSCPQFAQTDAELFVLTGKIEWKSRKLQDSMEPDELPQSIIIAEAIGPGPDSYRLRYEWFLDESS